MPFVRARGCARPRRGYRGPVSSSPSYPRRQFVIYRELVERGSRKDPEAILADFLAENPDVDLEQQLTFADWMADGVPQEDGGRAPEIA